MEKNKIKISISINIFIFFLMIIASVMMFSGFKFMHGNDVNDMTLETKSIGMLRFFTVQSNIFAGIISLVFAFKQIQILKGKYDEIPVKYYVLKLMATTAVGLTFLVVFGYLGLIAKGGILSLLMNSNLFFHLIIPVTSILSFILFEKSSNMSFKYTFYGIIPSVLYGIYYIGNILVHMENGKVSPLYDWYWFVQNGVWSALIVAPMIFLISYLISLIIWKLNKKKRLF